MDVLREGIGESRNAATSAHDGVDLELTRAAADRVPISIIASGGVGVGIRSERTRRVIR